MWLTIYIMFIFYYFAVNQHWTWNTFSKSTNSLATTNQEGSWSLQALDQDPFIQVLAPQHQMGPLRLWVPTFHSNSRLQHNIDLWRGHKLSSDLGQGLNFLQGCLSTATSDSILQGGHKMPSYPKQSPNLQAQAQHFNWTPSPPMSIIFPQKFQTIA